MKLTKVKYPITNPLVFAIVMKDAELRPTYVIFICTFDYYGIEEPIYFFEKYDVKKSLPYGDGTPEGFLRLCQQPGGRRRRPLHRPDPPDGGGPERQKGDQTDYDTGRGIGCTLQHRRKRGSIINVGVS